MHHLLFFSSLKRKHLSRNDTAYLRFLGDEFLASITLKTKEDYELAREL